MRRSAFTLIELLVVVAIIGLLVSILLPNLVCAREQARAAVCGNTLRNFGLGVSGYTLEHNEWFPGVNTTGANFRADLIKSGDPREFLRNPRQPVQTYDWMSPVLPTTVELGRDRAERFATLIKEYGCPSQGLVNVDTLWPPGLSGVDDKADFNRFERRSNWRPLSYLMPVHFQNWGQQYRNTLVIADPGGGSVSASVSAEVSPSGWEALARDYKSRIAQVGDASRKVMAADAMRYMTQQKTIDFDVLPVPSTYGSFTFAGGWWSGSTAYGVRGGSKNWDDQSVSRGSASDGANLAFSFRHTCERSALPQEVQTNKGSVNAVFFDGHVDRMNDRKARNIELWYPRGSVVRTANEGLTSVPEGNGFVIN